AGHWAYDRISKLAAAGIIAGYGDDTFRGDRLMTRYEMAQIVAKALAKGANVDRLAAEFADELDALGVRVAALEKKSDNVKVTGQMRYHYAHNSGDFTGHANNLRSRIWFTGKVNDNWNYVGMLQNNQDFTNNKEDGTTDFQRAYLEGRLGGTKVTAGRHDFTIVDANLYDDRMDGIKVEYGSKVKVMGFYGKPTNQYWSDFEVFGAKKNVKYDRFWGLHANADIGKFNLDAGYTKFMDGKEYTDKWEKQADFDKYGELEDNGIWHVGGTYNFGAASLGLIYMKSNADFIYDGKTTDDDAFIVTGTIKGAQADKVGSWGLVGKYYDQGAGTFVAHGMDGNALAFLGEGYKGWMAGGFVTVAQNMVAGVEDFDLEGKESDKKARTLWTQLVATF
ncbi:MAG: S-layer homology domain-containing protein, partial [Acidaminococcaceae bacterium]|nr:S-layer homology domain-containing protein [Acidaminococcaceae bacterium]